MGTCAKFNEPAFPPNIIVTRYFPSPDPDGKPRYRLQGLNFGSATAKVSANVTDFQTHQLLFKTGPITKFGPRFQIDLPLVACDSTPEDADKGRLAEMAIVDSVSGFHQEHIDIVVGCKPGGALF